MGKNSDRPARESQPLHRLPARFGGDELHLAYLDVEDAPETIPHLGSSPYWCWGHEMGLNAAGVVIGNEALFTRDLADDVERERQGAEVKPGLLGMELVRLALERASTAFDAVELMTDLIEEHGQWGAGTRGAGRAETAYDNSYLVADSEQIWILETSGTRWVTRKVVEPSWSISNEPTIRDDWDHSSDDLQVYARAQGWMVGSGRVDFAATFLDPQVPLQVSHIRLQRSRDLLAETLTAKGEFGVGDARRVLSDHYEGTFLAGPTFNPARPDFLTLCMHDHPSGFTWGNTAASIVAVLPEAGEPYLWWAAATPCTSVYLPVSVAGPTLPQVLSQAGTQRGVGPCAEGTDPDAYADDSYWWAFQALLETVVGDELGSTYLERQPIVRERLDLLQQAWSDEVDSLGGEGSPQEWQDLTARCTYVALQTAKSLVRELETSAR